MSSSVEQIKERLSIEDVVGSYVKLERAGVSLKARCPFHNEKTPSFFVSPERGSYYCFGCGAKGDIFTFVEQFEGIDFVGTLKILADRAGVVLEKFTSQTDDKKGRLYTLLEAATIFLQNNLQGEEIPLQYLKNRGLTEKTIKDWRVGYVRDEWRSISDYLKQKGFIEGEIERAGITKTEGKNTYDRFRGRIMFPIFDSAGRVIAFSGRILPALDDGKAPKYLNSPQTEIFDKSKVLYGFDRAKQSIRKFDFSILVEGQMDILMAHQAGFTNTVASSGTALTHEHLSLLKRISSNIKMSFDSDNAGAKAAERAWSLALSSGMEVKIVEIPQGLDPADLILKDKEAFKHLLNTSLDLIDFLLNRITAEFTDKKKMWSVIQTKVLPYVYLVESNTERSRYVSKISRMIDIKEDFIWDDLKKVKLDEEFQPKDSQGNESIERQISPGILKKGSVERSLAGIITGQESKKDSIIDPKDLRKKVKEIVGTEEYEKFDQEMKLLMNELAFETEAYYGSVEKKKLEHEIQYLLLSLQEDSLKHEAVKIAMEISGEKDEEKKKYLMLRHTEITKLSERVKAEKKKFL